MAITRAPSQAPIKPLAEPPAEPPAQPIKAQPSQKNLRDSTAGVVQDEVEVLVEGSVLGLTLPGAYGVGIEGIELTW